MSLKVNDKGKIIFRHPYVMSGKYGKVICVAVAKLNGEQQGRVKDGLEALLVAKPRTKGEFKDKIDPIALKAYFGPIAEAIEDARDYDAEEKAKAEALDAGEVDEDERFKKLPDGTFLWHEAEKELLQEQIDALKAQLAGVVKATGERTEIEKALTLGQCFEHFKAHTVCSSEGAKDELLRRVGAAVKLLGTDMPHSLVTKNAIDKAIEGSDYSPSEKPRILKEAKRFFRELGYPVASDGLGLVNPAVSIKVKQVDNEVVLLDPRPLLENDALALYWKALVACIGYGGFRLAEAASLEWDRIKDGIIAVRATEIYPELKSAMSERDVRPFDDLFSWLDKLKTERGGDGLLFPRINARRKRGKKAKTIQAKTWFRMFKGKPSASDLSGALADALNKARPEGAPKFEKSALRLRHFWETSMRERGLGHLIEAMGGHSDAVGKKHYTRFEQVVKGAKVGKL